jgi:hypothetical protein
VESVQYLTQHAADFHLASFCFLSMSPFSFIGKQRMINKPPLTVGNQWVKLEGLV